MCIQNLVKFCQSILKIFSSKNQFLTSFKGSNSTALGPIWPKFELIWALMHVIITCKYKKEWMKNSQEKVETPFFPIITLSVTMEGETSGWIWPKFQTHPRSHVCNHYLQVWKKFDQEQPRKSEKKWRHRFSHYKPMGIFSDVQGQLTPQSVVRAGRNSNSSELSCMSSLPASMKRIGWKTGEKKWRHRFLHYNPMGAFCCHGNLSSDPIWSKTKCSFSPNPMMLQITFGFDQLIGFRDIHVWKLDQGARASWTLPIHFGSSPVFTAEGDNTSFTGKTSLIVWTLGRMDGRSGTDASSTGIL